MKTETQNPCERMQAKFAAVALVMARAYATSFRNTPDGAPIQVKEGTETFTLDKEPVASCGVELSGTPAQIRCIFRTQFMRPGTILWPFVIHDIQLVPEGGLPCHLNTHWPELRIQLERALIYASVEEIRSLRK